jgi:hypothetical protein
LQVSSYNYYLDYADVGYILFIVGSSQKISSHSSWTNDPWSEIPYKYNYAEQWKIYSESSTRDDIIDDTLISHAGKYMLFVILKL